MAFKLNYVEYVPLFVPRQYLPVDPKVLSLHWFNSIPGQVLILFESIGSHGVAKSWTGVFRQRSAFAFWSTFWFGSLPTYHQERLSYPYLPYHSKNMRKVSLCSWVSKDHNPRKRIVTCGHRPVGVGTWLLLIIIIGPEGFLSRATASALFL